MKKSLDKRNYNRIRTRSVIVDYKIKGDDTVYSVELVNLAAGGMCFLRNSIVNRDDILTVKFPFRSQKILLTGQVIRIEGREVAVKFLNNDDEIKKFVDIFNDEYPSLMKTAARKEDKLYVGGGPDSAKQENDPNSIFDIDRE